MARQTADSDQVVAGADGQEDLIPNAEIVVKGRNVEVPEHYRAYVSQKLARSERLDRSIYHFDVELDHERNRRQRKACQRVEITARGRGPVVRAEARADSFYGAFESAITKLEGRLRRDKSRRTVSYGDKTPVSVSEATAMVPLPDQGPQAWERQVIDTIVEPEHDARASGEAPGQIARIKEHRAEPMSVDDALYEMELVGHDFFLFHDKETGRPSVVYRRHAYDYGLIQLS
ncbi:MAG TPA: ribosome-associated translation inhibitor RaiA [Mycobacterium sp.]|nr:ribosome-associated translation inhibitor RaiA [Mycobacterium sp.]